MKVMVTGATGFVGSHLAERLLRDGHAVTVLVRRGANRRWVPAGVREVEGSLDDAASLSKAVAGQERIFHVAGAVRAVTEQGFHAPNVAGMQNLVTAILGAGGPVPKVIHISSLEAGGPAGRDRPKRESDPDQPASAYGRSKRDGEAVLQAARDRIPSVILRPCVVYGPRDIGIFEFYKMARWHLAFTLAGPERYVGMIYVDDLVEGVCLAAERPVASGSVYYVDDGHPGRGWIELQELVGKSIGARRWVTMKVPVPLFRWVCLAGEAFQRATRRLLWINRTRFDSLTQASWCSDSSRAQAELGYKPKVPVEEGLRRTTQWYRDAGWIR